MENKFYNDLLYKLEQASDLSGGPLRQIMGDMVETFTDEIWNFLCEKYPHVNAEIKRGPTDPIKIVDNDGNSITESVDRHCYINGKLILAIECKTYLDKCFMQRADSDFHLMKTSNNFEAIIVAFEDATAENSFNFFMNQGNIDNVYFLANSRRSSSRHISRNRDNIKKDLVNNFVSKLESYFINAIQ